MDRWRGRWAGYGKPRVRRLPRPGPRHSLLEVAPWVVVFSLAVGDLLYAGSHCPLCAVLTMVAIGGAVSALVNWSRRRR
jgi:hypothetical protein